MELLFIIIGVFIGSILTLFINHERNLHLEKCKFSQNIGLLFVQTKKLAHDITLSGSGGPHEKLFKLAAQFEDKWNELDQLSKTSILFFEKPVSLEFENAIHEYKKAFRVNNINNLPSGKTKENLFLDYFQKMDDFQKDYDKALSDVLFIMQKETKMPLPCRWYLQAKNKF